jgi:hypothetical protein
MTGPKQETIEALTCEIERARDKFPSNAHLFLALVEEVGELSKDLLEGNPGWREEALQVACVALRLYEEGDPTTPRGEIEQGEETQRRRGCRIEGCNGYISRAVLGLQCFSCGHLYEDEEESR